MDKYQMQEFHRKRVNYPPEHLELVKTQAITLENLCKDINRLFSDCKNEKVYVTGKKQLQKTLDQLRALQAYNQRKNIIDIEPFQAIKKSVQACILFRETTLAKRYEKAKKAGQASFWWRQRKQG